MSTEAIDLGLRYGLATRHTCVYGKSGRVEFMSIPAVATAKASYGGSATSSDSDTAVPTQVGSGSGSGSDTPQSTARKVYDSKFLLTFREHYTDLPEGLPSIDIILGKGGASKAKASPRDANNKHRNNGRDGRDRRGKQPPVVPVEPLKQTDGRWQRPSTDAAAVELLQRNVLGLLNKLTLEKFESLGSQFAALKIYSLEDLTEVCRLVFEKAILEQHFCSMYADLCKKLSESYPSFVIVEDGRNVTQTFKRLLLNMCQKEFECLLPAKDALTVEEVDDSERKYRRRTLGNIRFIGELFKLGLLREAIMHSCVTRLLVPIPSSTTPTQNGAPTTSTLPTEEDLEALCKLLRTMGKRLDHPGVDRQQMDRYFTMIANLSTNRELPSRNRFMLLDLIDLRKNEWVPRREVNGPKTIAAVHADVCPPFLSLHVHLFSLPSLHPHFVLTLVTITCRQKKQIGLPKKKQHCVKQDIGFLMPTCVVVAVLTVIARIAAVTVDRGIGMAEMVGTEITEIFRVLVAIGIVYGAVTTV
jgi:hypothetical protein